MRMRGGGCLQALGWVIVAGMATAVITLGLAFYFANQITEDIKGKAEKIAQNFERNLGFRPEIRVGGRVVVMPTRPEFELVTASRNLVVTHRWEHTFLGSTKRLELQGEFVAKAGFKLSEPLRIGIRADSGAIQVDVPNAVLLSLEMGELKILEDREQALEMLRQRARQKVMETDLLLKARLFAEEQIRGLLSEDRRVEVMERPQSIP